MCRYMWTLYPTSFACLPCRHVAQFPKGTDPICPKCRQSMTHMGYDFKAPRKRDDSGWKAVEHVIASGRNYDSCGCNGPGPRPSTSAEVRQASFSRPWKPRRRR